MRILIVEDEHLAVKRLSQMITRLYPDSDICGVCDSVDSTIDWLKHHPHPDFAFFDIQLGDGLSFEIFEQTNINFPIIFTTAYDQYALKAFKVNSLDYLLKPIEEPELRFAIDKFQKQKKSDLSLVKDAIIHAQQLLEQQNYKTRFLIKVGEHLRMIDTSNISFFYSEDKSTYLRTFQGNCYALDQSLDQYEIQLNPSKFHRISRKFIVSSAAISDIISYSNSRLKLKLTGMDNSDEIVVSRERVKVFKSWLENGAQ